MKKTFQDVLLLENNRRTGCNSNLGHIHTAPFCFIPYAVHSLLRLPKARYSYMQMKSLFISHTDGSRQNVYTLWWRGRRLREGEKESVCVCRMSASVTRVSLTFWADGRKAVESFDRETDCFLDLNSVWGRFQSLVWISCYSFHDIYFFFKHQAMFFVAGGCKWTR